MRYRFTKLVTDSNNKEFRQLAVLKDGEWFELPPVRASSMKLIREILEAEYRDVFQRINHPKIPRDMPCWTGRELAALRFKSGLSQNDFGRLLGVCTSTLMKYEASKELPLVISGAVQYLVKNNFIRGQLPQSQLDWTVNQIAQLGLTSEDVISVRKSLEKTQKTFGEGMFVGRKTVGHLENYGVSLCQSLYIRYFYGPFIARAIASP